MIAASVNYIIVQCSDVLLTIYFPYVSTRDYVDRLCDICMEIGNIFDEQKTKHVPVVVAGDFNFDINGCSKDYRECAAWFAEYKLCQATSDTRCPPAYLHIGTIH